MTGSTIKRPYRRKAEDVLLNGSYAPARDIRCDYAVAPFDRVVREADEMWGIDVLPTLVTPQMAEKFGGAVAYLNQALQDCDPDKVAAAAMNCIKGIEAMTAMAIAAGHSPKSTEVWEFELDGRKFGIMRHGEKWKQARKDHPGLALFTPREVAAALRDLDGKVYRDIEQIRDAFPGAEIVQIRDKMAASKAEDVIDDDLPF